MSQSKEWYFYNQFISNIVERIIILERLLEQENLRKFSGIMNIEWIKNSSHSDRTVDLNHFFRRKIITEFTELLIRKLLWNEHD